MKKMKNKEGVCSLNRLGKEIETSFKKMKKGLLNEHRVERMDSIKN